MLFNGKSIKSVANKVLNKLLHSRDELVVEVKTDAWRSMYPFFCNQALSTRAVAIESLKILDVLIDHNIVGDYKNLQKVLLHKNDEVAHLALDVLRKIKGLTIEIKTDGVKSVSAESSRETTEPHEINQQIKKTEIMQKEKALQSQIFNVLKKEDSIDEEMLGIEEKVNVLYQKTSGVADLTQDYDNKFKALEDSMGDLKKLVSSNIVNENTLVEKVVAEKLTGIEEKVDELYQKTSEVPDLTQGYDNKFKALEDGMGELKKLVSSNIANENTLVEKAVAEELTDIKEKVEELGHKISEVPSNLTQDYDNRFKPLEDNIEELKKLVDSNSVNENALAEKVAGQVLECIKPKGHIPKSEISSIPQLAQKKAEDSQYSEEHIIRLPSLDNTPETAIILLNWVKFLMEKIGRNNLADVLEYYVEIGWISEEVSSMMADYANGIDYYVEKSTWNLPEVHTKSLLFIEQLKRRKKNKKLFSLLKYKQESTNPSHIL